MSRDICKDFFIKTDTLYIDGNLYKVYPFLWNRLYIYYTRILTLENDENYLLDHNVRHAPWLLQVWSEHMILENGLTTNVFHEKSTLSLQQMLPQHR